MGSRMASRLIQAGFQVAVWNRTASACEELIDIGTCTRSFQHRTVSTHFNLL